jgi:hypothetical protein
VNARDSKHSLLLAIVVSLAGTVASSHASSLVVEAESGALGADWAVSNSASPAYITILSNLAGNAPSNSARVATYTISFPEAGTYQLYARIRVGPNSASDDSLFYANGFGAKNPSSGSDWVLVNNLWNVGFTNPTNVVTGAGTAGTQVWKWINLSQFTGNAGFTVSATNLTQTFQIGGREDGLDLDKLVFGTAGYTFTVADLDAGAGGTPPATNPVAVPPDMVTGNLIQFNDNGNWTWYCDERTVVDKTRGRIIVGSDGNPAGVGGSARSGAIEVAMFDLQTGFPTRVTLLPNGVLGADDHNTPGLLVWPDGKYLAQWTGHNQNYLTYFSIFDGTNWNPYTTFDWQALGATSSEQASYSNPHYLSAENRTYTFVRTLDNKSMNILLSTNEGGAWTYYGKLNRSYPGSGYNPGYYRFCDNGSDRIDFICTESHPRDSLTSIYHGYISNSMSFKTDGTLVDGNLNDTNAPLSSDFMLVFSNGTIDPVGQTNYRCWNSDVQHYPDGTVQAIIHARINQSAHIGGYPDQEDPNHAFFFCRWNGTNWTSTYLCQAGYKLYSAEADYVGLGALSPNDPNTIYISTKYDPRAVQPGVTDTNQPYSARHEIWKGVTTNQGASFIWTPITQNSTRANLRPIVPPWDSNNIALIWFRGTYNSAQNIDSAPVGLIQRSAEVSSVMTYVDANTNNTTLSTGAALVTGNGTGQWHLRTTTGNNGDVLASADVVAEDAPMLKTTVTVPAPGTYDVWVNFWGNPLPGADWRIRAGLATNQMQIYRQMASKTVQPGDHNSTLVLTNSSTNFLYQAYAGRAAISNSNTISVFVDDYDVTVGTTATHAGNTNRTWYDGVSYALVTLLPAAPTGLTATAISSSQISLSWALTSGATSYHVKRATASGGPYTTLTNLSATSFMDTGLAAGTPYYYVVSAVNAGGEGTDSAQASATTWTAFQAWQMTYFACTNCPQADGNADPFGKGMSNTNQFLAGLDPTNSASLFRIISVTPVGDDVNLVWQGGPGKTSVVQAANGEYSTNFADISAGIVVPGSGITNHLDAGGATNVPSRFYRVRLAP